MTVKLKKEEQKTLISSIQKFFLEEFELEIGVLRARFVLDYFTKEIAPSVYNSAISDAQRYMVERIEDMAGVYRQEALQYWIERRGQKSVTRGKTR